MLEAKGLNEFNQALNRFRDQFPDTVQKMALSAVTLTVTDAVPTIPRKSGRAAKSVQGFVTNQGARVEGGRNVEYYRWLELGGASGRNHANKRPIRKEGRYINPAYERNKARIQKEMEIMFTNAARQAGLEVT